MQRIHIQINVRPQGDIQSKYDGIDKDTPIPTDRQVRLFSMCLTVFTLMEVIEKLNNSSACWIIHFVRAVPVFSLSLVKIRLSTAEYFKQRWRRYVTLLATLLS